MTNDDVNNRTKDIERLVSIGDVKLAEYRQEFKKIMGRDTKLNDRQLCKAIALMDDEDYDELVDRVLEIEHGRWG